MKRIIVALLAMLLATSPAFALQMAQPPAKASFVFWPFTKKTPQQIAKERRAKRAKENQKARKAKKPQKPKAPKPAQKPKQPKKATWRYTA